MTSRLLYLEVIKNYCTALSLITHISPGIPEVLPVITTECTMNQVHAAALHPTHLPPPDPGPKVKRATPGPTVQKMISTQPPAPRNTVRDDLHPARTLAPCPGRALALGPGLAESLEVTDCLPVSEDVSAFNHNNYSVMLCFVHHDIKVFLPKERATAGAEVFPYGVK